MTMFACLAISLLGSVQSELVLPDIRLTVPFTVSGSEAQGWSGLGPGVSIKITSKPRSGQAATRIEEVADTLKKAPDVKAFNGGSRLKFAIGPDAGGILRYNLTLTDGKEVVVDYAVLQVAGSNYEIDLRAERNNPDAMSTLGSVYSSLRTKSNLGIPGFEADQRWWQDWESKRLMTGLKLPHTPWMAASKPAADEVTRDAASYHDGTYDVRILVAKLKPASRRSTQNSLELALSELKTAYPELPSDTANRAKSMTIDNYPSRRVDFTLSGRCGSICTAIRGDQAWTYIFMAPNTEAGQGAITRLAGSIKLLKSTP